MRCHLVVWIIDLYRVTVCLSHYFSYPNLTILFPFVFLCIRGTRVVKLRNVGCDITTALSKCGAHPIGLILARITQANKSERRQVDSGSTQPCRARGKEKILRQRDGELPRSRGREVKRQGE
jgi:hypothetical protein